MLFIAHIRSFPRLSLPHCRMDSHAVIEPTGAIPEASFVSIVSYSKIHKNPEVETELSGCHLQELSHSSSSRLASPVASTLV